MGKSKQLFINLGASIVVFLVQFVISFWLSPFVVEKLGEEAYGFITLANNFTQYATLIAVSINSMANRYISLAYNSGDREKANQYYASVFWMNLILSAIVFVVATVLVWQIENLINVNAALLRDVKLTFALSFLNLIISFLSTCFTASTFVTNRMDLHAYTQIASNVTRMFVILGTFLLLSPKIYFVTLAGVISSMLAFVFYMIFRRKLLPGFQLSRRFFSVKKIWELARSGVWLLISDISSMFLNGMDLLVANLFVSQSAMGRLSISKTIPLAVGGLLGFLSNTFAALFTDLLARKDMAGLLKEVKFTLKILGLALAVPFAGVIVFGVDFFSLWLPANVYDGAAIQQVYILMLLTLTNVIINAFMYSIHSLLIAFDKVRVYSIMVFICSIISISLTLLLTSQTNLGIYAIAGTSTMVLGLMNLLIVPMYAERVLGVQRFTLLAAIFKNHGALIVLLLLFFAVRLLIPIGSWITFFAVCGLCAVAGYLIIFVVLLNQTEKSRLIGKIQSKLKK